MFLLDQKVKAYLSSSFSSEYCKLLVDAAEFGFSKQRIRCYLVICKGRTGDHLALKWTLVDNVFN